jgi:hypothetical protein
MLSVGFADQGNIPGLLDQTLSLASDATQKIRSTVQFPLTFHFEDALHLGAPSPWRKLALDVTPDGLRVHFDGAAVAYWPRAEIETRGKILYGNQDNIQWRFAPQDGVGLFVERGSAEFRRVVLRPLRRTEK